MPRPDDLLSINQVQAREDQHSAQGREGYVGGERTSKITPASTKSPAKTLENSVLAPALRLTAERLMDPEAGYPEKRPDAMLAKPSPTNS